MEKFTKSSKMTMMELLDMTKAKTGAHFGAREKLSHENLKNLWKHWIKNNYVVAKANFARRKYFFSLWNGTNFSTALPCAVYCWATIILWVSSSSLSVSVSAFAAYSLFWLSFCWLNQPINWMFWTYYYHHLIFIMDVYLFLSLIY